jgi:signal transduction histidine kinase
MAMALWLSVYVYIDIQEYKKEMISNISIDAKLIGEYSILPLYFDDKKGAGEILSKLQSMSHIVSGSIYNKNHKLFASYNPSLSTIENTISDSKLYPVFSKNKLTVVEPILYNGEKYGYISITAYTNKMTERTSNFIIMALISFMGVIVIAWMLANQFQKIISKPLFKLASIAKKVSNEQDYSIRIERETDDEVGFLFDSFNRMLEQINRRDIERSINEISLQQAKVKAENADKLKSAFLANMSHEIRTPMNSIIGFSALLDDETISADDRKSFVKLIQSSGDSLLSLIDDIIDISKIEADQLKIYKSNVNVTKIINELFVFYKEELKRINKTNIELIKQINENAKHDLILCTDANRFKQILINLLSNALKFTDEGFITLGYDIPNENEIRFYVKDTGIGIPHNKTQEIFDRFNKIESINKLYRGAGLGLAITMKLVSILGGKVWVESTLGKGSEFYFTLPFISINNTIIDEPVYENFTPIKAELNWKGKTILVAEDEVSNFKLIEEILKHSGVKIIWAQNGKVAIEICNQQHIDLVLMDIKMPEIDGYEATKIIKSRNARIKIISQTAFAMISERDKIFEAGCDDYIAKPIKPLELKKIMAKYL